MILLIILQASAILAVVGNQIEVRMVFWTGDAFFDVLIVVGMRIWAVFKVGIAIFGFLILLLVNIEGFVID